MIDNFRNVVRGWVAEMIAQMGVARHGIVQSVDPARGVVKVSWDEFGTTSGWIPIAQPNASANTSTVTLPVPGTQMFCVPDMGDQGHMVAIGAVHFDGQPPGKVTPYGTGDGAQTPQALTPGEPTMMHSAGASLRLTTDPNTGNPVIEIVGNLKVTGDLIVTGDVYDINKHFGSLSTLRDSYNQHQHTGVQTGGGTTGLTTIVVNHH